MKLPERCRAVVTGGGSGLGRALALRLARERKARVVVGDIDLGAAEETARLVAAAGGEAVAARSDVAVLAEVEALAQLAETRFGGVDLVANNAGVAVAGLVGELPLGDWDWIMRINLWGVIHGCHVFVPRLRAAGRGWILNVASSAGFASLPEMAPYNVTKAGVISLSETLSVELAPAKITVSCLCPTFFKTNLLDRFRGPEKAKAAASSFFARSRVDADGVAAAAIAGLERGRLIVIPQRDGRSMWRIKRLAPALYDGVMRAATRYGIADRIAGR